MWIKICANTNLEDALLATELGANALGFVFAPSPRRVTPEQAAAITEQLPEAVERIGVFGAHTIEEIADTVERAHLTGAQLHGTFHIDVVRRLRDRLGDTVALTQTLHWDLTPEAPSPAESLTRQLQDTRREPALERVLVDSRVGNLGGGTGVAFDWIAAARIFAAELGDRKLIVAGGLNPENVGEAIRSLAPWGVDVASGVEARPGKKDPKKLEAFLRKASSAASPDSSLTA